MARFCKNCGSPVSVGAKFCKNCGAPIDNSMAPNITPTQSQFVSSEQPAKKKSRGWLIGVISATAVIVIALVGFFALGAAGVIPQIFGPGQNENSSSSQQAQSNASASQSQSVQAPLAQEPTTTYTISQVDNSAFPTVTLYTDIKTLSGGEVSGITANDLTIIELTNDGVDHPASVKDVLRVNAGDAMALNLVLDQSSSMSSSSKMSNAKSAANAFVDSITSASGTTAEITSFDDYVYSVQPFTSNQTLLHSAINSLKPNGDTALYDALYWGLQRTNNQSGSRVVIGFTDGEENASHYTLNDVVDLSHQTGIPVYIIGIGSDVDASSLRSLASQCNGSYFDANTADLSRSLSSIYDEIYAQQRALYRVIFESACSDNQTSFRTIKLNGSGNFVGSTEASYVPQETIDPYRSYANVHDYVLADSNSRYYSASELEGMSLWELYLARNEIFARHGRGFVNKDLTDYFATRTWYNKLYTPEQFDALGEVMNDYEKKNIEVMLSIEQSRNSPYLSIGDH